MRKRTKFAIVDFHRLRIKVAISRKVNNLCLSNFVEGRNGNNNAISAEISKNISVPFRMDGHILSLSTVVLSIEGWQWYLALYNTL